MTSAPRIIALSAVDANIGEARALGFSAVLLREAAEPAALASLAARATAVGLRLLTVLPPDEAVIRDLSVRHLDSGVSGFLAHAAQDLPGGRWRGLIEDARARNPDTLFIADLLGAPAPMALDLRGVGFDFLLNSVRWWDGVAPWFLEQQEMTRWIAGSIGFPDLPGVASASDSEDPLRRRLMRAALLSAGLLMDEGVLDQDALRDLVATLNRLKTEVPALAEDGPMRRLSTAGTAVTAILRTRPAEDDAALVVINTGGAPQTVDLDEWLGLIPGDGLAFRDITPGAAPTALLPSPLTLAPYEIRVFEARPLGPLIVPGETLPMAGAVPRLIVERVTPNLDGGRYPVKRVVGDRLDVAADIFRDGHDKIAAALWVQTANAGEWRLTPMRFWDNDRWIGSGRLDQIGRARFAVSAWTDHFASWRDEVTKKRAAGAAIDLELIEGMVLIAAAVTRADGEEHERLRAVLEAASELRDTAARAEFLLSNRVAHAMARVPDRGDIVFQEPSGLVEVDRETARFSAWYGMFPRSQGTVPNQAANFADCIARLPDIQAMGFDVLYLVPIHPIGTINRKGRDNSVTAEPGEPGSPYAIGSDVGGHTAIDPELGTLEDFRAFVRAAQAHGMELALDFAIQCAPDHPWLAEHPNWFKRRPDGSMKYAENPPKKYQDIVNVDFDQPDWPALWAALRDILRFWIKEGVKIFRVDNPHTKPVAFWEWLITEIRRTDPDVLFLAEAFTKPKMMHRLAKVGFTQSYTYFTWRNTKWELTQYLTELTRGEQAQYYRPNFFTNTPDILPLFLQEGGRAGFRIRLVLAATLSPSYGIYNGFELCEAEAIPGREEYLHSEKYQYKVWDWDRPGHIKDDIRALNQLRHASPALRLFDNLRFHEAGHDDVLFYSKITPDRSDAVLVAVTLNPHQVAHVEITLPLDELGLPYGAEFTTVDAITGEHRRWSGARHWIMLDPAVNPALVLHLGSERAFR